MLPFTRVPFGVPIFDPQPCGVPDDDFPTCSVRGCPQVYGECENYGVMKGHANAVLEAWGDEGRGAFWKDVLDCAEVGSRFERPPVLSLSEGSEEDPMMGRVDSRVWGLGLVWGAKVQTWVAMMQAMPTPAPSDTAC